MLPAPRDDRRIIAEWDPACSLADVLANYHTCDLFARYLIETGAGPDAYQAVLFGYAYLNNIQYDYNEGLSSTDLKQTFTAGCRRLVDDFERFHREMDEAGRELVSRRLAIVTVNAQQMGWATQPMPVGELCAKLPDFDLVSELRRAARSGSTAPVSWRSVLATLSLEGTAEIFQLTVRFDDKATTQHNAALLNQLQKDRDTCCYLQLESLVVLYDPADRGELATVFLEIGCQAKYGHSNPGVIERIGRVGLGRDYFAVHCPSGPDPNVVRLLVSTLPAPNKVVIHPF